MLESTEQRARRFLCVRLAFFQVLKMKTELPPSPERAHSTATIGATLAALGLAGWICLLLLLLRFPYADAADPQMEVFVGLNNFLVFLIRAMVGLVGMGINFTLLAIGLMRSLMGLKQTRQTAAYVGIGCSAAGMLLGVAIVIWRLTAVGLLS